MEHESAEYDNFSADFNSSSLTCVAIVYNIKSESGKHTARHGSFYRELAAPFICNYLPITYSFLYLYIIFRPP